MNEPKFTQGEWIVTHSQTIPGKEFKWIILTNDKPSTCIADVFRETNANLISASPDMYKALRAVEVSLIEDEYYQHFKPLLKTVKEALNKANGVKVNG